MNITRTLHHMANPRHFLALSCLWLATWATAQTNVYSYVPGITPDGATYFLPRTALRITVKASRITKLPGDFKDYAARYMRLTDVTQEPETTWQIDQIGIETYGVPDSAKVYTIPLRKKTVAPLMSLSQDGVLLGINTEVQEERLPEIKETRSIEKTTLPSREYMTPEILSAGSTAKMAELTADEIYDIRESRSQLSKGLADNMPKDGEQLKLMLKQLDTQEEALLQLFRGSTESETIIKTYHYMPIFETDKQVLLRLSKDLGLVAADNLAGDPVYISIKDQHSVPAEVPVDPKMAKKIDIESVRYNLPSNVAITIFDRTKQYTTLTTPMGQFGHVELLSPELFNRRLTTRVTFHGTTGGLKQLSDSAIE